MDSAVDALLARTHTRADARRNAEKLLEAARVALAEQGLTVTTRDVAHRAGVGLGTLYRRIPSLDALLAAILTDTINEMTTLAQDATKAPDPWQGFKDFAEVYVRLRTSSCGLHDVLSGRGVDLDLDPHITRLQRAMRQLIRRAQTNGAIRQDLNWHDVPFILATAIPPDHTIGLTAKPDQWRQNLRVVLAGLRPEGH